jgi:glutamine synthetase
MTRMIAQRMGIVPEKIQRSDIMHFISENGIQRLTYHYAGLDGKLKDLIIPLHSRESTERILSAGERVDGSSLFKGMIPATGSDLYVVPYYPSAFLNPFDPESLDFICRFIDQDYSRTPFCPDNLLHTLYEKLKNDQNYELWAHGELEFYLLGDRDGLHYEAPPQSGYHASAPFSPFQDVLREMVQTTSDITGLVKYGHSEVGMISRMESADPQIHGKFAVQYEIEMLPAPVPQAADTILLAKWVVRNVAYRHGLLATFAPKISDGNAGTGMHFHLEMIRDGVNRTRTDKGLSDLARQCIGGLCDYAPSLSAFGNTIPSSYFRLIPHQEAPTQIYWSDLNRSALIRVPLGWPNGENMAPIVNPCLQEHYQTKYIRQTFEIRSPDGSAFIHLLLSGITHAILTTFSNPEKYLHIAESHYVEPGDTGATDSFESLPGTCQEAAEYLQAARDRYRSAFPEEVLDWVIRYLQSHEDGRLQEELKQLSPGEQVIRRLEIMHHYFHIQ